MGMTIALLLLYVAMVIRNTIHTGNLDVNLFSENNYNDTILVIIVITILTIGKYFLTKRRTKS